MKYPEIFKNILIWSYHHWESLSDLSYWFKGSQLKYMKNTDYWDIPLVCFQWKTKSTTKTGSQFIILIFSKQMIKKFRHCANNMGKWKKNFQSDSNFPIKSLKYYYIRLFYHKFYFWHVTDDCDSNNTLSRRNW